MSCELILIKKLNRFFLLDKIAEPLPLVSIKKKKHVNIPKSDLRKNNMLFVHVFIRKQINKFTLFDNRGGMIMIS